MVKKLERMAMLFDFYGKLLTKKQQEMLALYYEQDLSLGEIAEEFEVSRQAIHDIIKRSEKILEDYEEKLGLVVKFNAEQDKINKMLQLIDNVEISPDTAQSLKRLVLKIQEISNIY